MVAPVTSKTFPTAETHTFMRVFVNLAKQDGGNGLNCFFHHRELAGPESKLNRPNKDVLYSHGVFDLSAGIVQVKLPQVVDRYMSACIYDENHYIIGYYTASDSGPIVFKLNPNFIDTRYVMVNLRLAVKNESEVPEMNRLQDQVEVVNSVDPAELPDLTLPSYDPEIMANLRKILFDMSLSTNMSNAYGSKNEVDPIAHMCGACFFVGLGKKMARYHIVDMNDTDEGNNDYQIKIPGGKLPCDEFWSVTVYNSNGQLIDVKRNYFNSYNYKLNSNGDCFILFTNKDIPDSDEMNIINYEEGCHYVVRMYEPHAKVLDGSWVFPAHESYTLPEIVKTSEAKTVIITGSSNPTGIGAAAARGFARLGWNIVIHGRKMNCMDMVKADCEKEGASGVICVAADLEDIPGLPKIVEATIAAFGRIDALVNNGSYACLGDLPELQNEHMDKLLAINVKAPMFLTQAALPHLKATGGSVVNISSMGSQECAEGYIGYLVSKAALDHFTKTLACNLIHDNVAVNCIAQAAVRTDVWELAGIPKDLIQPHLDEETKRQPFGGVMNPEDMVEPILMYATRRIPQLTGQRLLLDCGRTQFGI